MTIRADLRYGLLTVAWLAGIYWLSSLPDHGGAPHDPRLLLIENFSHAPIFGALAWAWHKTVAREQQPSARSIGLAFLVTAACAALDEWHQRFVPGRDASIVDLMLDLAGISAMLVFLHWRARRACRLRTAIPTHP
jgi:VanZ family protein